MHTYKVIAISPYCFCGIMGLNPSIVRASNNTEIPFSATAERAIATTTVDDAFSSIALTTELRLWLEYEIERLGSELKKERMTPVSRANYFLGKKIGRLTACKEMLSKINEGHDGCNKSQFRGVMTN